MKKAPAEQEETKERILEAAEALFAERGFEGVSVRDITQAAQTHLSAVNYHFGSKKQLYVEVFRQSVLPKMRSVAENLSLFSEDEELKAEETVSLMVRSILSRPLHELAGIRAVTLIAKEMLHPSEALDMLATEHIKPTISRIGKLLLRDRSITLPESELNLCVLSIFAQCMYFTIARAPVSLITGRSYDEDLKEELVRHITRFTMNGLKGSLEQ